MPLQGPNEGIDRVNRPYVVDENGERVAVLLDIEDYERMVVRHHAPAADDEPPSDDDEGEALDPYRHKNAEKMLTRNWYGYYWAKRTEEDDYEIRSVPSMLGEHSVPGGTMPKEGFEQHYEKVDSYSGPQRECSLQVVSDYRYQVETRNLKT